MMSSMKKYCFYVISFMLIFFWLSSLCVGEEPSKAQTISILLVESKKYPSITAHQLTEILALAKHLMKSKLGENVSFKVVDQMDTETFFSGIRKSVQQDWNRYFFAEIKALQNDKSRLEAYIVVFPGDREAISVSDVLQFLPAADKSKIFSYDDALKVSFNSYFNALSEVEKGKIWGKVILDPQKMFQYRPDCIRRVFLSPSKKIKDGIVLTNLPAVAPSVSILHQISQVIIPTCQGSVLSTYPYVANMDFGTLRKFNKNEQVLFLAKNLAELAARRIFQFPNANYASENKQCLTYNGYVLKDKTTTTLLSSIISSSPCKYETDFVKWSRVLDKIRHLTEAKNYSHAYKQVLQLNKNYTFPKNAVHYEDQVVYALWNAIKVNDKEAIGKYKALVKKYEYDKIYNAYGLGTLAEMVKDLNSNEKAHVKDLIKVDVSP